MSPEVLHTIQGIATNVMLLVLVIVVIRAMSSRAKSRDDIAVVDDAEPLYADEPGERYIRYCKAVAAHKKAGLVFSISENERIAKLFGVEPGTKEPGV